MLVARTILIRGLCAIGMAGLLGCVAAVLVPPSRVARVVRSSNVRRADGWRTGVLIIGMNRSGVHFNALRRDWGGEESIFNSAWESTEYGFDEGVGPGSSFSGSRGSSSGGVTRAAVAS